VSTGYFGDRLRTPEIKNAIWGVSKPAPEIR
jgi:hypothetical protein